MTRTLIATLAVFFTIGCLEITPYKTVGDEPDSETDSAETVTEICGNGYDDDRDSEIDEAECLPGPDADDEADAPEDTAVDSAADVPADTAADTGADSAPDAAEDSAPDVSVDTSADTSEDDASTEADAPSDTSAPPEPVATIFAAYRSEASADDAIETQVWGDLTRATYATLPGAPSRLCIFGSWNDWSTTSGFTCLTWSPTYTPTRLWHHRGGDTGFYFLYGSDVYELDFSKFGFDTDGRCYRSSADRGNGTVRYVMTCPANPEDALCDDGLDNDGDGMMDAEDEDCDTIWGPPIVETNVISGRTVLDCVNFSGKFYFNSGRGLVEDMDPGERAERVAFYTDGRVGGEVYSPRLENYPGDGEWVHTTICGFTYVIPRVVTSWGREIDVDLSEVGIHGSEICRNPANTRIGTPATGCGDGGGYTPPPPVESEVCDGADNDADGVVDNGFTCPMGSSRSCTTSCGSTGRMSCGTACSWGECVPPDEVCGNGIDDDCDGTADESPCGSATNRYELSAQRFTDYVELEIVSDLRADHEGLIELYPDAISGQVETICVVYGSANWDDQIADPFAYHTDPELAPCVHYRGDDQSHYIRMEPWAENFLMFVIDDHRNRAWFNTTAWTLDNIGLNEHEHFVVPGDGSGAVPTPSGFVTYVSEVACPSEMACFPMARVLEVSGNLNAHRDESLVASPQTFGSFEDIAQICAAYGEDWAAQLADPYHEPCQPYPGDGSPVYLQFASWATTFNLYAIGEGGSISWFNITHDGFEYSGVHVTESVILAFN